MSTEAMVSWLRGVLDDEERVAEAARRGDGRWEYRDCRDDPDVYPWQVYAPDARMSAGTGFAPQEAQHMARHDPAWVLREVEAKRRIIDRYEDCLSRLESEHFEMAARGQVREYVDFVLPLLALPFSDRPGYREEWRP